MLGPLWLPPGSVRAFLAMCVVFVTCWLSVKGETVPTEVAEALLMTLAFYFAGRAMTRLSSSERQRVEAMRAGARRWQPLFLPRGTVRFLMVMAFLGLAAYLVHQGGIQRLLKSTALVLVLAFFAGQLLKLILRAIAGDATGGSAVFEHLKALLGVLVGCGFVALYVTGYHAQIQDSLTLLHRLFLGFMIFYFGSR